MCRTPCLLAFALIAVHVGLAHSWDIAIGVRNQLIFYTEGIEPYTTVDFISEKFGALAYDEVHNRMIYVDKQNNSDAICGYGISSRENKCFINRAGGSIHSIAFDPTTQTLFFTDTNDKTINWISLKPGSADNVKANLLIKIDDGTPTDIAVDSCRGYIYWINKDMMESDFKTSIQRAQFDGFGKKIIFVPHINILWSLVIDPLTQKIYYLDCYLDVGYRRVRDYLNHVDLNGKNMSHMYYGLYGPFSSPRELTVTKYNLYWVHSSNGYNIVWQFSKNTTIRFKNIRKILSFRDPLAIATNYKIEDQIEGLEDCVALSNPIPTTTVTENSLNSEQTTEYITDVCNCTPDYIGERCEVSVCQNYCLHGNCSLNNEGLPTCSCNAGYTGERCQVYICHGYCLNGGDCSLNEKNEPVCQCPRNHKGLRCESAIDVTFTINNNSTYSAKRNLTLIRVTVTVEI